MPNLRSKTWTTTTPANVEDAQYWEDHLISDADAAKIATSVQSVNNTTPDAQGNVDIVALPSGGTAGQVLTKQSSTEGDADWEDPASSGHTIIDENGDDMPYRTNLQFTNAEVTDDSVNDVTIVDCKGSKGDPGQAATITVGTVTTLPAGSSATVTNTGTSSAAVFDFGIPKGADGTGAGDMLKADYDPNSVVELAGGIPDYVASQAYTLPTAASNVLGGVKVGTNLSIDANGVLSATDTNTDALHDLTDVNILLPSDGQALLYDSTNNKWVNGDVASGSGGSIITVTTTDSSLYGQTVTITDGTTTLTETLSNTGEATFEGVTLTGSLTVSTTGATPYTLSVPYYGNYSVVLSAFSATITITFPYSNGATCTISDGDTTLTATESPMAFSIPNTGTWVATCTLDGQSKTQSFVITTDGQTESHTFEYGTINLTFDNEFRGLTVTCANGGTVISKTAPISGNTMAFYPPSTGEWTISSTYSGVPYSTSATVVSLSTAVSAILQTNATVTVTLYSAVEDTVSFTDSVGAKTVTFESGQSSKSVSIVIPPSGMSITFTSSVAKNPDDLSQYYSNTVSITNETTEVKVMHDNVLYWWGYENGIEDGTTANGWSSTYTMQAPTHNTNSISLASSSNVVCGIGSSNRLDATNLNIIAKGVTIQTNYGSITAESSKTVALSSPEFITSNELTKYTKALGNNYAFVYTLNNRASDIYAVWYE